jgi:hypothetical protein
MSDWRSLVTEPSNVNQVYVGLSKLDRNVPGLTSLEMSPFLLFGFLVCGNRWPGLQPGHAEPEVIRHLRVDR